MSGYRLWFGLGAGYRFGWYDPKTTFGNDTVMEHTVGVRYDLPDLPLALSSTIPSRSSSRDAS